MKPTIEQIKIETRSQIERLIEQQTKALKIKDLLVMDKEITKILNEKNKLTMKLMSLR